MYADDSTIHLLRAEGAGLFIGAIALFSLTETSWWLAAIFFLAPDLSLLAFLFGPRAGVAFYNLAHSTLCGLVLAMIGVALDERSLIGLAAIWLAHVGFDRLLGYGLKHSSSFYSTHLGEIGSTHRRDSARRKGQV